MVVQGWGADAAPALAGSSWANMAASGSDVGATSSSKGKKPNKQRKGGLSMFLSGAAPFLIALQSCLHAWSGPVLLGEAVPRERYGGILTGGLEKPETSVAEPSIATPTGGEPAPWRLASAAPVAPTSLRAILSQEAAAGNQVLFLENLSP